MGLAFLNKKSWHTGSFKNIEEVWKAKEKHKEMLQKREEIRKKVVEEKYSEELKKMQVEAGLLPSSALNRMEWMHGAHDGSDSKNNAEAYLLGKAVNSLAETQGALKPQVFGSDGNEAELNEDFVRLVEDPLYIMAKETEKRRREMMANPVKMRDIFEEVKMLHKAREERKKAKKEKKEKKDKKEKRAKDKEESRSRSRSRDSRGSRDRKDKKDKKERKDKKEKKRHRHRSASSSRRSSDSRDRKTKKDKKNKDKSRNRDSSTTALSSSEDEVFNEYVKQRLGPLVEFDPENYRLRFTAKHKFKTNVDKKAYTQEEREKMVEQMKRDAEAYEKEKLERYERDIAAAEEGTESGSYLKQMHTDAMQEGGRNTLGDNLNRGRYFHDKHLARGD